MEPRVFISLLIHAGGFAYFIGVIGWAIVFILTRIVNKSSIAGVFWEIAGLYGGTIFGLTIISWGLYQLESGIKAIDEFDPAASSFWGALMASFGVVIYGFGLVYREEIVLQVSISQLSGEIQTILGFEPIARLGAMVVVFMVDFLYIGMFLFGLGSFYAGIISILDEAD